MPRKNRRRKRRRKTLSDRWITALSHVFLGFDFALFLLILQQSQEGK
jgi:hypothetical protein